MQRTSISLFFLALLLCITSCNCNNKNLEFITGKPIEHIILVGFDGLSSSSINNGADMPMLRKLMSEGAYTLQCRSILPSSSAPNWASMFMGAGPELHGYTTWGSKTPDLPARELASG